MQKLSWALALTAALLISACASMPEKGTETESLVIVKTEVSNPRGLQRGHEMVFHYSGGYPDSWVGQYSWEYNLVVVKESGVMLESYGAVLQSGRGQSSVHPVNYALPYSPGGVAVADFVFTMKIEQTGMYEYMTTTGFRRITQEEKDQLIESLKKDGRFASWMRPGPDTQEKQETLPEQTLPEVQALALPEKQETLAGDVLPTASFKINGNLDHWKGIPPAFLGKGVVGNIHIDKVFLAADEDNLYMRFDVNDTSPPSFLHPTVFDASRSASYGLDIANGPLKIRAHVYVIPEHGSASPQWYTEIDSHIGSKWKVVDSRLSKNARKGSSLEASFPLELILTCLGIPAGTGTISVTARTGYINSAYGTMNLWSGSTDEEKETSWRKLQTPWKLIEGSGDTTETRQYNLGVPGQQ